MPAASFLTPASQLENFDGFVGDWHSAAEVTEGARKRKAADRQRIGSFTVRTPWLG
jgi:hypothetical protein